MNHLVAELLGQTDGKGLPDESFQSSSPLRFWCEGLPVDVNICICRLPVYICIKRAVKLPDHTYIQEGDAVVVFLLKCEFNVTMEPVEALQYRFNAVFPDEGEGVVDIAIP